MAGPFVVRAMRVFGLAVNLVHLANLVFTLVKLVEFLQMETPVHTLLTDYTHDVIIGALSVTSIAVVTLTFASYTLSFGSYMVNYSLAVLEIIFACGSLAFAVLFLSSVKLPKSIQSDLWLSASYVKYDQNDALSDAWMQLHQKWNCCGSYGPDDWIKQNTSLICDHRTEGCGKYVENFLNEYSSAFCAQFFLQTLFWLTCASITISLGKSIKHLNCKSTSFTR